VPWPLGVYRGPPEVYRGPCMKITRLNTQLSFTDVAQQRSTKLCTMFDRLLGWCTIHICWRLLLRNGTLPCAKFTLGPSLAFRILAALLHGTRAVGVSQTLRRSADGAICIRQGGPSRQASAHILGFIVF